MLRRLRVGKATAAVATATLVLGGAVVLAAPAAHAAPVEYMTKCVNQTMGDAMNIPPSLTKIEVTVSPAKPTYQVGEVVDVNWKWLAYSDVPLDTPAVDRVDKDSTLPIGVLGVSGAQSTEVEVRGERKNPEALLGEPLILSDMTGRMTLGAAGTVNLTPARYSTWTLAFGGTVESETRCAPVTPPAPVAATITVEEGQTELPTVQAPTGRIRPGNTIDLTGANYTPNATPTVALCDASGLGCEPTKFTANTLLINGEGKLSGTATLASRRVVDGQYMVRVSDGVKEAKAPLTIENFVPVDPREAEATAAQGPVGTTITVTGRNWLSNTSASIMGVDSEGGVQDTVKQFRTSPEGTFSETYTVAAPGVTSIRVEQGFPDSVFVHLPWKVTDGGIATQDLTATISPGGLTMTQAASGIDFGTATLNGQEQTLNAALNQVTVVDARGANTGWSLTGTMSDLTSDGATLPASAIGWTPACAATETSPAQVVSGTAGTIGDGATLCSSEASASATGGKFTADAAMTLTTPAFVTPGAYTGTLTLTLS